MPRTVDVIEDFVTLIICAGVSKNADYHIMVTLSLFDVTLPFGEVV